MGKKSVMAPPTSTETDSIAKLRNQYGCGPIEFAGTDNALYATLYSTTSSIWRLDDRRARCSRATKQRRHDESDTIASQSGPESLAR